MISVILIILDFIDFLPKISTNTGHTFCLLWTPFAIFLYYYCLRCISLIINRALPLQWRIIIIIFILLSIVINFLSQALVKNLDSATNIHFNAAMLALGIRQVK